MEGCRFREGHCWSGRGVRHRVKREESSLEWSTGDGLHEVVGVHGGVVGATLIQRVEVRKDTSSRDEEGMELQTTDYGDGQWQPIRAGVSCERGHG